MKTMTKKMMLIPIAAVLAVSLAACSDSDDGAAEQMGRKMDNAAYQAEDKMEDARDSMSNAMEKAGDKIEHMGDEVESKTD